MPSTQRPTVIYLAGPLFTEAERAWMRAFKKLIEELAVRIAVAVDARWPWEFIPQAELEALGDKAGQTIYRGCVQNLEAADILIAWLDGTQVDDGTAWEVGYFYRHRQGKTKPTIGIRTDLRNAGELKNSLVNVMIEYSCDKVARSQEEMLATLEDYLTRAKS